MSACIEELREIIYARLAYNYLRYFGKSSLVRKWNNIKLRKRVNIVRSIRPRNNRSSIMIGETC